MKRIDILFGASLALLVALIIGGFYASCVTERKYKKDVKIAEGICYPYRYETYFIKKSTNTIHAIKSMS